LSFAEATAVERSGDTTRVGEIHPGWDILGNANGGYLLAIVARAAADAAGRPDPVTVTAHYLAPGKPGPVHVDARVLRSGRRFATVSATLSTADRPLVAVLGTFGDLTSARGPERVEARPPELPPPDECIPLTPTDTFPPPFAGKVDMRLHPDDVPFSSGPSKRSPRVRGWFRLPHGEPLDTLGLLVAVDAFPPTSFNANLPVAWTPTIELTAHIRARPVTGWMRCMFTTRFITGGFLEEDGEVWDETGRLVAQSRQLALVPTQP
jgi:acyl-CoA thioesterase